MNCRDTEHSSGSVEGREYSTEAVKVRLFGREYSVRGHGNCTYVEKLATFINERAEEIRNQTSVVSTLDLAILTLLNITDEMFQREPIKGDTSESEEDNHKA